MFAQHAAFDSKRDFNSKALSLPTLVPANVRIMCEQFYRTSWLSRLGINIRDGFFAGQVMGSPTNGKNHPPFALLMNYYPSNNSYSNRIIPKSNVYGLLLFFGNTDVFYYGDKTHVIAEDKGSSAVREIVFSSDKEATSAQASRIADNLRIAKGNATTNFFSLAIFNEFLNEHITIHVAEISWLEPNPLPFQHSLI